MAEKSILARGTEIERDFYHLKAQEWAIPVEDAERIVTNALAGFRKIIQRTWTPANDR